MYFSFQGNKGELLSLVTLSTVPPQVSTGAGQTRDAAHDGASLAALRALAMVDSAAQFHTDPKPDRVDHRGDG